MKTTQTLSGSNNNGQKQGSAPEEAKSQPGPVFVRMSFGGQDLIDRMEEVRKYAESKGTRIKNIRFL